MKNLSLTVAAISAGLFGASGGGGIASATAISVSDVFDIIDSEQVNDIGVRAGDNLFFGANTVAPNASQGTTDMAQSINTLTGQTVTVPLVSGGSTAFPNQISDGLGAGTVPFSAGLNNPWTLTFTNGGNIAFAVTPSVAGVNPLPFASNVQVSSGTNPTLTWINPAGAQGQFVNIVDKDIKTASGGFDTVLNVSLAPGSTSFTVPTQLAGGLTLDPTHHYAAEISEQQFRPTQLCAPGPLCTHENEQAVSRVIADFTVLPSGAPPNVYLPIIDAKGVFHFDTVGILNGQLIYIDPVVATGLVYATGQGDPNFASVLLPNIQSDAFDVTWGDGSALALGGQQFFFPDLGGVSDFTVTSIDVADGLDPQNPTAFITGLTFEGAGSFTGTMTPITQDVPEPGTLALLSSALFGFVGWRRG
jgi:hypothetical protein